MRVVVENKGIHQGRLRADENWILSFYIYMSCNPGNFQSIFAFFRFFRYLESEHKQLQRQSTGQGNDTIITRSS